MFTGIKQSKMKKLKNNLIKLTSETRLYQIPVPIIGLTGGIATGKSTVSELFSKNGIAVIDADRLVKNIYQYSETKAFVFKHFPEVITNNEIDFKKLREIVFNNQESKTLIENYIYSHMPMEFRKAFSTFKNPEFIIYDVPLLFEKGLDSLVDLSICVYAPKNIQLERIIKRDNCSLEVAKSILSQQMDIDEKKKKSNFVIENTDNITKLSENFKKALAEICQ